MEQPTNQREYEGTPTEIGLSIFIDCMVPIIEQVAKQPNTTDAHMAQFYSGVVAGMAGFMAADFGKEAALEIIRGTADRLEASDPPQGLQIN